MKKCQWTWNSIRNGFDIVGPSKNSIFIPTLEGEWTDYWTRTLEPRYNCCASTQVTYGIHGM